jgi:glucokinase
MRPGHALCHEESVSAELERRSCRQVRNPRGMTELVAIDIGGTHARFALAAIAPDGSITLGETVTLATDLFPGIESAWDEFASRHRGQLPNAAAIAIAAPVTDERVRMTNNSWEIDTTRLAEQLDLERATILNDFAAVAHTAARASNDGFLDLAGPDEPLPGRGTISVIGPGTGLGVAHFHRFQGGYRVQPTEGSHIAFAPTDALDDAILVRMRERYLRVSVERVVSGPGIVEIHAALAVLAGGMMLADPVARPKAASASSAKEPDQAPGQAPAVTAEAPKVATPKAAPAPVGPFVIKRILPISGPIKYGEWHWDDTNVVEGPIVITVDLEARVLSIFKGGYEVEWGYVSHGCIGMPEPFATKIFAQTKVGDRVFITRGKKVSLGDSLIDS